MNYTQQLSPNRELKVSYRHGLAFEVTTRDSWGTVLEYSSVLAPEELKELPEVFQKLYRFRGFQYDGPIYYPANTIYHAGERDWQGLLKGEVRQGVTRSGASMWTVRVFPKPGVSLKDLVDAGLITKNVAENHVKYDIPPFSFITAHVEMVVVGDQPPDLLEIRVVPLNKVGEGKDRDLDAARVTAYWPEATEEDLTAPGLKERLEARLPGLIAEFKALMEEAAAWRSE